jgi:hypothetical protein
MTVMQHSIGCSILATPAAPSAAAQRLEWKMNHELLCSERQFNTPDDICICRYVREALDTGHEHGYNEGYEDGYSAGLRHNDW